MTASELCIGNYVINQFDKLKAIDFYDFKWHYDDMQGFTSDWSMFKPIPLTEEWLLKLGAEKDENGDLFIPYLNDLRFYLTDGVIQLCKSYHAPIMNFEHIKYVHQFQNLHFLLTGK